MPEADSAPTINYREHDVWPADAAGVGCSQPPLQPGDGRAIWEYDPRPLERISELPVLPGSHQDVNIAQARVSATAIERSP